MTTTVHGVVHGNSIQLTEPIEGAEGREVELVVRILPPKVPWGEGIKRSAGAMAPHWTEQDDRILEELQRNCRQSRREIPK